MGTSPRGQVAVVEDAHAASARRSPGTIARITHANTITVFMRRTIEMAGEPRQSMNMLPPVDGRPYGLVTSITQCQRATAPRTRSPIRGDAGAKAAAPVTWAAGLAMRQV